MRLNFTFGVELAVTSVAASVSLMVSWLVVSEGSLTCSGDGRDSWLVSKAVPRQDRTKVLLAHHSPRFSSSSVAHHLP